ncbi:MAG: hypothetical protein HY275_08280, partial [Gemmatimonadetes bacterium]|nr:hypothetical protein [Gemmatimonadota bacterium]
VVRAAAALALAKRDPADAIRAAQYAQQLDALDPVPWVIEAEARALREEWHAVRTLAERALALDPSQERAGMLRALASELEPSLGARDAEWRAQAERFPHNPHARTGAGWSRLRAGDITGARTEFDHAALLGRASSWAREGMLLAGKTRLPLYPAYLRYRLWMNGQPPATRTWLVLGVFLVVQPLALVARNGPSAHPLLTLLPALYLLAVAFSWLADPAANLAVLWRPRARDLLALRDRQQAVAVGACLAVGVAFTLLHVATPWDGALRAAAGIASASLPAAAAFALPNGARRTALLVVTTLVITSGLLAGFVDAGVSDAWLTLGVAAAMLSTWYATAAGAR